MLHRPPTVPRPADLGCLADIRRWRSEAERLRESAAGAALSAAQSARLLRDAHAADRRADERFQALREH